MKKGREQRMGKRVEVVTDETGRDREQLDWMESLSTDDKTPLWVCQTEHCSLSLSLSNEHIIELMHTNLLTHE